MTNGMPNIFLKLRLKRLEEKIQTLLPRIIEEGWTAKKVEEYLKAKKPKSSATALKASLNFEREEAFVKKFKAKKVKITSKSITITFKNNKELNELLDKLS